MWLALRDLKQWSVSQKHIHLKHRLWRLLRRQMIIFSVSLEKQDREDTRTNPRFTCLQRQQFLSFLERRTWFLSSQKQSSHLVLLHFMEMGFCGLFFCCVLKFPLVVLIERKRARPVSRDVERLPSEYRSLMSYRIFRLADGRLKATPDDV